MKTKLVIAGNATTAEILAGYLAQDTRYEVVGMTVDDAYVEQGGVPGLTSTPLSKLTEKHPPTQCRILMAMGYNGINCVRESFFLRLREMGYTMETYIHPGALVFSTHAIGEGSVLLPSAVVEPHAIVGENTLIWCNVTLAHHSQVADHCWLASGAVISGKAKIGRNAFIGVNATVTNEVEVGQYCIIGGGALITKNTKPSTVHLARSAEELRFSSEDYDKHFGI
jgi:sugar O-acyltransferase (sialic acid O-acetyltransferase NeuD family)